MEENGHGKPQPSARRHSLSFWIFCWSALTLVLMLAFPKPSIFDGFVLLRSSYTAATLLCFAWIWSRKVPIIYKISCTALIVVWNFGLFNYLR